MDSNIQIQTLKSQIENMKLQIDNISMQNNNMFMMNHSIGGQLINLSMQMLNTGIQTFNIGKTKMMNMNMDIYYEQLKKVSEQINTMLNEYNMEQQQMMIQQQIMIQQEINENQNQANNNNNPLYINLHFKRPKGDTIVMSFKYGTKVYEALYQFTERIYGHPNDKIVFVFNAKNIDRNEQRTVENFFKHWNTSVQVLE